MKKETSGTWWEGLTPVELRGLARGEKAWERSNIWRGSNWKISKTSESQQDMYLAGSMAQVVECMKPGVQTPAPTKKKKDGGGDNIFKKHYLSQAV
jgi:hypothetical protein